MCLPSGRQKALARARAELPERPKDANTKYTSALGEKIGMNSVKYKDSLSPKWFVRKLSCGTIT